MEYSSDVFFHNLAQTTPSPLAIPIARAEGVYLYGPDGTRYMDLIAGLAVSNVGHNHPRVVEAIRAQVDKHLHVMVYGEYIQSAPNQLADYFVSLLPASLHCVYFVNSGAEANEGALKLAKRATGRSEIVACRRAYHGSTHGALSVSGDSPRKEAFRPLLPDVRLIEFGRMDALNAITSRTACVLMETIQGDAGVRIPTSEYLQAVRKKCDDTGALLILDEIQCGMGRTGSLFAFERFGVTPDILTVGKAFGGGLPLGALVARRELMRCLTVAPSHGHLTTFGGNPVCCAAALATLRILQEEGLPTQATTKGKRFDSLAEHTAVHSMRRAGLMMVLDMASPQAVQRTVNKAIELGAICFYFLSHPHGLRLSPPLTITEQEIDQGCDIVLDAISKTQ